MSCEKDPQKGGNKSPDIPKNKDSKLWTLSQFFRITLNESDFAMLKKAEPFLFSLKFLASIWKHTASQSFF